MSDIENRNRKAMGVGSNGWLAGLVESWEITARHAFTDAEHEESPMGKKVIEMKAMNYFNCSNQIRAFLDASSPATSTTQEEHQTQLHLSASKSTPAPSAKATRPSLRQGSRGHSKSDEKPKR